MKVSFFCFCAAVFAFLLAAPASGQVGAAGHILGQVVSAEGIPIAGATVELVGQTTRRVQSDAEGEFGFLAIPAGSYTITASLLGYNPSAPLGVEVAPAQTQSVILTMSIAPIEIEGIEAISSSIEIDTENTDFDTEISETQIDLLPVSYDPNDLVALTPGVRPGHVWGGATAQANNYQLDGITANHPGLGGDLIQPSINWIESIEVKGLGAGAQHGNFQGGLVNVITKTGSNEFQGAFYSSLESAALNGTNLVHTEIGSEIESRYNLEAEVRGPIIKDHLFYFLAGQRVFRDAQYINHLPNVEARFSPVLAERTESKYFGKLTWVPGDKDVLEGSFGWLNNVEDQFGNTGYQTPEAMHLLEEPTRFYNLSWAREWNEHLSLDAKLASYAVDRSRTPSADTDVPGILSYGLLPPNLGFQNAPLRFKSEVASLAGTIDWTVDFSTWGWNHSVVLGGERSVGSFVDQRLRNGGMTWRPPRLSTLTGDDPSTWYLSTTTNFIPTTWGGEVNLDSEVVNDALYIQSNFALGPRLNISPGLRWGRWIGRLTPAGGGETFTAVEDAAYDPRIGLTLDVTGNKTFVAKAHWGRYHQSMVGQFFDRAEGGNVFTNEQIWYYRGPRFDDPRLTFTEEERDLLAETGQFTFESEIVLNETGPVVDYDQPYVDQWVVGLEKTIGSAIKVEAVYVNRRNRDMVALVDRNRDTNYTRYEYVTVADASGQPLPFSGGTVQLRELYLPNSVIIERLKYLATCGCTAPAPPGLSPSDTLNLSWNPDYVLTNAPGATRKFDQIQLSAELSRPTWGANASLVWTDLRGNLDNVTGYEDPSGYGAGPYVRVNEATNSFGKLANYSERVLKISIHGKIVWGVSGGLFYTAALGDHYSPRFTLSSTGLYQYNALNGGLINPGFLSTLEGHTVFIGPRGFPQNRPRKLLDVHLERELDWFGGGINLSLDIFNLFNTKTVTDVNTSVNYGRNFYHFLPRGAGSGISLYADENEFYKATLERVPPRTVRIGTVIRF